MPTYEYRCPLGHEFELLQKMSQPPRAKCPTCGRPAVRQMSGGAGLIFKGSGFYITDYGKDGKGPRQDKETEPKLDAASAKSEESSSAAEKANPKEAADPAAPAAPAGGKPDKGEKSPKSHTSDKSDKSDKSSRKKSKS
jgi:putative FmdB family regulatory protein